MKATRFFRNVWRFNAIVLALAAVITVLYVIVVGVIILAIEVFDFSDDAVVQIDEAATEAEEDLQLGGWNKVAGWPVVCAHLYSGAYGGSKFGSGDPHITRNLLFYYHEKGEFHWLLEGHEQIFDWYAEIPENEYREGKKPMIAYLYEVYSEDTNGNSMLDYEDRSDLAISSPDGSDYRILIRDIGNYEDRVLVDKQRLLVFYERDDILHVAEIDLDKMEMVKVTKHEDSVEGE